MGSEFNRARAVGRIDTHLAQAGCIRVGRWESICHFRFGKDAARRRYELSDDERNRSSSSCRAGSAIRAGNRLFVNAVIGIGRSGAPWRDLPERFGLRNSVFQRFNRWAKSDVWELVYEEPKSPDLKAVMLDSTVIRAPQQAVGS